MRRGDYAKADAPEMRALLALVARFSIGYFPQRNRFTVLVELGAGSKRRDPREECPGRAVVRGR